MSRLIDRVYFWLRPLSLLYSLIMQARCLLYRKGIWKREKMEAHVISVGNLTMGGTGKTPVVQYIARFLAGKGFKPAIISRGYGGSAKGKINLVSDGRSVFLDAKQAGDEPRFLAESLPGIPVLTGKVRSHPCRYAVRQLGCDILILDDGFQHLSVMRDIDLVLFNALTLAGNNRVFPGGPLREPFSALSRADAFLLTGTSGISPAEIQQFSERLVHEAPDRPVFHTAYNPAGCRELHKTGVLSLDKMPTPLYGFCGIAGPERFLKSLQNCGIALTGFSACKDHQDYSSDTLEKIAQTAIGSGAIALITTEKDMVKLHALSPRLPLYSLSMDVEMEPSFESFLLQKLKARPPACRSASRING